MTDRPPQPSDPNRRRFFRVFAGDVASTVGGMLGAAQVLQQQSAEAARDLLGTAPVITPSPSEEDAAEAGYRTPYRWDGDVCRVVDQRRLPDVLVDIEVRGAADAVSAINEGAIIGAAVQAQLAAITLALVAGRARESRAFARRATIRGAANALRLTRPGAAALAMALDRQLALLESLGNEVDGPTVEAALRAEAEAIIAEANAEHSNLAGRGVAELPAAPDQPIHVLTHGSSGAMAGGQFGTALGTIITAHHAGRRIHALVAEGRPLFDGSRIAAWELKQAGVEHAVVTDAAAPGCIAGGEVEAVLVVADRVAANGDVIAPVGAYPLALAASAAGIPFFVSAPVTALDPATPDGASATIEEGRPGQVQRIAGGRIALEGTKIRNPLGDLVTADLVTAIVTSEGVLRAPFGPAIAAVIASAAAKRTSAGWVALVAKRAADARAAEDATAAGAAPANDVDGVAATASAGAAVSGVADGQPEADAEPVG